MRTRRTATVSISLDETVWKFLRDRADSTHGGNFSAAVAEAVEVFLRKTSRRRRPVASSRR
jgi:hypothetical protein